MIPSVDTAPAVQAKRWAPPFSQCSRLDRQASVSCFLQASFFLQVSLLRLKRRPSVFALARSRFSRPRWHASRPMTYEAAYTNANRECRSFELLAQLFGN
jgi:hypothetical protein